MKKIHFILLYHVIWFGSWAILSVTFTLTFGFTAAYRLNIWIGILVTLAGSALFFGFGRWLAGEVVGRKLDSGEAEPHPEFEGGSDVDLDPETLKPVEDEISPDGRVRQFLAVRERRIAAMIIAGALLIFLLVFVRLI
ncbi:MAG: hypothetical protein ABIR47_16340 [Candidatus Kapaibacterium sp.]